MTDTASPSSSSTQRESLKELMARKKREKQDLASDVFDPYANASSAKSSLYLGTGLAFNLDCQKHKCEWDPDFPERPERLAAIIDRCNEFDLISRCIRIPNDRPYSDLVERIKSKHSMELYSKLKSVAELPSVLSMEDEASNYDAIYFNEHTFEASCSSLASVLNLVDSVATGEIITNGIALVRPPGHHAMKDQFCGYCYFNNVAIAAEMCIEQKLASKILIVDYDVHHGQATQQMFYDRNDVLYFSIHRYEHGTFWPNLIESNYNFIGVGQGLGYNINVPLNDIGLNDSDYLAIVFNLLLPVAYEFNPDLIIVSAGYDAAIGCPEGQMNVTPAFYAHLITLLSGLAKGKIAVCLEGGYFLPSLAEGAALTLKALLKDPCPPLDPTRNIHPVVIDVVQNIRRMLFGKWHCFHMFDSSFDDPQDVDDIAYQIKYFGTQQRPPYATRFCYPTVSNTDKKYYTRIVEALSERHYTEIRPVCYVFDDRMLMHRPDGDSADPIERPERISSIHAMLKEYGLVDGRLVRFQIVNRDFSEYNIHDQSYIERLCSNRLDDTNDIYTTIHTYEAISTAVSGLLTVIDGVMNGHFGAGIAVIRPPGHHAEYDAAMGFCLVNNIAIAANYLLKQYKRNRVLIVDFDIHHGNGTQNLFYATSEVMYISIHRFDNSKFFPCNPIANYDHHGYGCGEGFNVNIPLNKDKMSDAEYLAIFHNIVLPIAYSYAPQAVLVSAGFDAGVNDPLGGYNVSPETFGHLVQLLKPLAEGKLVLCLEGGYNLATTSYSMAMCTKALLNDPIPVPKDLHRELSKEACFSMRRITEHFTQFWPVVGINKRLPTFPVLCQPIGYTGDDIEAYVYLDKSQAEDSAYVEREIKNMFM